MAMRVPALRVGQRKPANEARQLAVAPGPDDQVPMIGHHAVGQQPRLRPLDGLEQDFLERLLVGRLLKDREPAVGPVQDMIDIAPECGAVRSSHRRMLNFAVRYVNL